MSHAGLCCLESYSHTRYETVAVVQVIILQITMSLVPSSQLIYRRNSSLDIQHVRSLTSRSSANLKQLSVDSHCALTNKVELCRSELLEGRALRTTLRPVGGQLQPGE